MELASVTDASCGHALKALVPMLTNCVAPLMSTEASKAIWSKASFPMVCKPLAPLKSTSVTVLHALNA